MINPREYSISNILFTVCLGILLFLGGSANASDSQILTVDEIEKGAVDHLANTLPWARDSLEINAHYKGNDLTLPSGEKELVYKIMGSNKKAGRIPLTLVVKVNGNYKKRFRINSRVLVSQEVIKTTRSIRKGEILSDDNIQLETIQTERPGKNVMRNLNQVLGYEAGRNLQNGKILTPKFIKKPALGNRGDKVLILAEKAGMKITAPGLLKEDGYKDAMVQVLNLESKKMIYGKLVDANTVKVNF